MTLDELLLEWSYRSDKGYPDMGSPSDIQILKEILSELDLPTEEILSKLEADKPGGDDIEIPGTDGMEDSSVEKEKEKTSNSGDIEYDAVIRKHLDLKNDQPIPRVKNNYPFPGSGGATFSIQVKGDDLKYWKDFWTLTPPKKGAEIGTTSKGSGDGEISLYWLYQYSDSNVEARGTQGADNPDLEFDGVGVEVKAYPKHTGKHGLGRFGQDVEQLKMLGVIFGINALATQFKGIEDGKKRAPKNVNPLTWDGGNLKNAMEEVLKFSNIDLEQLAAIPGYDIFKEIKENMDFLGDKLGDYSTAEEGARAMALEFVKPKIARKPGPGGFLVNVLNNGNCKFWQIDYNKILDNKEALKHIKASQGSMQINFEELFGN